MFVYGLKKTCYGAILVIAKINHIVLVHQSTKYEFVYKRMDSFRLFNHIVKITPQKTNSTCFNIYCRLLKTWYTCYVRSFHEESTALGPGVDFWHRLKSDLIWFERGFVIMVKKYSVLCQPIVMVFNLGRPDI